MYCSAILFSPETSITRRLYSHQVPKWILRRPTLSKNWSPYLQILSHLYSVNAVAFSPDGKLVASGSHDRTVRLWDAATGTERRVLKGHSNLVYAVAFSPNGKLVASGSHDSIVRLWDAATGTERRALKGHSHWVYAVAFSPDGKLVASGSGDRTVRIWDAATGIERRVLKGHLDSVYAVAFSPDGKLVASGSLDNTVRLWDAVTGTEQCAFGIDTTLRYFSFSSCGTYLITDRGILQPPPSISQPLPQIYASRTWIREDEEDLLFLHPDCRDSLIFVAGSTLVFVDASNHGSVLQFSSSAKCVGEGI
jgi:WD40 repeat protein